MRDKIIIPDNYNNLLVLEARKEGLISPLFGVFDSATHEEDFLKNWGKESRRYVNQKQHLFQLLLLYGEIILSDSIPVFDYTNLKEFGINTHFLQFEAGMNAIVEDDNYCKDILRPAIIPRIESVIRGFLPEQFKENRKVIKAIAETVYHSVVMNEEHVYEKLNEEEKDLLFFIYPHMQDIIEVAQLSYSELCWLLDTSITQDAYIYNSKYKLEKIGVTDSTSSSGLQAYRILKCEYGKIFQELPGFSSLRDVLYIKKKKKDELRSLRREINHLEEVIFDGCNEKSVQVAIEDIKRASKAVNKNLYTIDMVGSVTTVMGVPLSIMPEIMSISSPIVSKLGIGISALGVMSLYASKKNKQKNGWIEIIR